MATPQVYMAATVPRYIRQTKLARLPENAVIGTRALKAEDGTHQVYDVIMLPFQVFQRMKLHAGFQPVVSPDLRPKGEDVFTPIFVPMDVRQVTVPEGETDPAAYAKAHFVKLFRLA